MPFRFKIVFWYTLVVLATLIVVRLMTLGIVRREIYDELDSSLWAEVVWMKNILYTDKARGVPDDEIRDEIQERSSLNPRKEFITIRDSQGRYFLRSNNLEEDYLPNADSLMKPVTLIFRGQNLRLIGTHDAEYSIAIGYSLTDVESAIDKIVLSSYLIIPLTILFVFSGGLFLARRFMAPIRGLNLFLAAAASHPPTSLLPPLNVKNKDELGELSRRVAEAVARMRESMRWILSYSSLVPHQLRTPIAIIRSQLENAMEEGVPSVQLRQAVASTYDEILRLNDTIEDLLNLGKLEAGTLRLQMQNVAVRTFLEEFREEVFPLVQYKKIQFSIEEGPAVTIMADLDWMRQALFNLLDNAIRHTPEGGSIGVVHAMRGNMLEIRFSDSGEGIPPEEIPRLFEPFFQGESRSDNSTGAGLGLMLVKSIVSAHHGSIDVRSTLGNGTTFIITLPLAVQASADITAPGFSPCSSDQAAIRRC